MNSLSILSAVLLALFILSLMDKDLIGNFSCDPCKEKFVKENSLKIFRTGIFEPAFYDIEEQRAIFEKPGLW